MVWKCFINKQKKPGKYGINKFFLKNVNGWIMKIKSIIILFVVLFLGFSACQNNDYSPKPKGYYRIDFPEKAYTTFPNNAPFGF